MNKVTLKQWQMFLAVVKYGGFAQASEKVFKSTSSIHHSVSKLEGLLNVSLLQVEGRKTHLTSLGKKICYLVEKLLADASNIESYLSGLESPQNLDIKIAIDELFPIGVLRGMLQSTCNELNQQNIEITQVPAATASEEHHSDVVISLLNSPTAGFTVKSVMSVDYAAVRGAKNSAFGSSNVISANELHKHIEIKVDREATSSQIDSSISSNCWKVDNLSSVIELVCEGIGYAWLPYSDVQHLIAEGKLCKIVFSDQPDFREVDFYLKVREDLHLKPATANIVNNFKNLDLSQKFEPRSRSHMKLA